MLHIIQMKLQVLYLLTLMILQRKKDLEDYHIRQIGLNEHQIDSIFASYDLLYEQFLGYAPKSQIEETKIQGLLGETGHEECNRNPLPDVPVHFLMAGGFTLYPDETPTIYDRELLFRINSNIQMKRWIELLYPLKYGKFFYSSNSEHAIQIDDPELVISSIKLALSDYYIDNKSLLSD